MSAYYAPGSIQVLRIWQLEKKKKQKPSKQTNKTKSLRNAKDTCPQRACILVGGDRSPTGYVGQDTNCGLVIKAKEEKRRCGAGQGHTSQSRLGDPPEKDPLNKARKEARASCGDPGGSAGTTSVLRHSGDTKAARRNGAAGRQVEGGGRKGARVRFADFGFFSQWDEKAPEG